MNGLQYIYTFDSLGLSFELQDRLQKHVTGRSVTRDGVTIEWRDLRSLKKDLKTNVQSRRFLGDVYFKEFSEKFILEKREAQKRRDPENLIIEIDKKINSITEELQTV